MLEEALARAGGGQLVVAFIGGEAGVGKTRLAGELTARARRAGLAVLQGGCIELSEGSLPYAPVIEALRGFFRSSGADRVDDLVGPARETLSRLLPEVTGGDQPGGPAEPDPATARVRLFQALADVIERAAQPAGAVVLVEDLHWADPSTRDFLRFLIHGLPDAGLMLAVTYRTDELHPDRPLRPYLASLEQGGHIEWMELKPLDPHEVGQQMEGILGQRPPPELAARIAERSEGNPLFVEELLAARAGEREDLPATLKDTLLVRFEARSPPARDVLRTAAAGGERVSHALIAAVVGGSDQDLIQALREAVAHHLLVPDSEGRSYSFRHALMREAIQADLLPGERRRLHAAFARTLSERPDFAAAPGAAAAEIAFHWDEAGEPRAAMEASMDAGRAAEASFAFAEATRHYERALKVLELVPDEADHLGLDRVGLLRQAAETAQYAGEFATAIRFARSALELLDPDENASTAGMLFERLARYLRWTGETMAALDAAHEAVRLVPAEPPSEERANALAAEAHLMGILGWYGESRARCLEAIEVARIVGARAVEGRALNTLGDGLAHLGDPAEGAARQRQALTIAREVGTLEDLARAHNNMVCALESDGLLDEAARTYREGMEMADRRGMAESHGAWMGFGLAGLEVKRGRWEAADRLIGAAAGRPSTGHAEGLRKVAAGLLATRRGDLDAAVEHLAEAGRVTSRRMDSCWNAGFSAALAELALARGDPEQARSVVDEGIRRQGRSELALEMVALCLLGLRAEADRADVARARRDDDAVLGAVEAAEPLVDRAEAIRTRAIEEAGGLSAPLVATLDTMHAELSRLEGRSDPVRWERAWNGWEEIGQPFEAASCRRQGAEALLEGQGDRDRAGLLLREAHRVAVALGAAPLRSDVESLARRARIDLDEPQDRVQPEPPAPVSPGAELGLSGRELEVLALVGEGMTNVEIGRALFISQKTASAHVSHILAKLGVRTRVQAAGVAHRLGLVRER